jgi:mannose-6-phosphate isomerase-like protein (cupin superfamily)
MKFVKKNGTKLFEASEACRVFEYQLGYKDIDGVVAKITGRYPDKGFCVNKICRELGYVIEGQGKVVINDTEISLNTGDLVCIDPNEKFFWEGNFTLFLPCAPAWNPNQHKFVD